MKIRKEVPVRREARRLVRESFRRGDNGWSGGHVYYLRTCCMIQTGKVLMPTVSPLFSEK